MELTNPTLKPHQCRFVIAYGGAYACDYGGMHCVTGCTLDQGAEECPLFRLKLTQKPKKPKKKTKTKKTKR